MSEQIVAELLAQGNKQDAVKRLYEMIVAAAHNGEFAKADNLRQQLIAVDDMALFEIVGSAEVIEAAKSAARDPSFQVQWKGLCSSLTDEENNALYFSLKEVKLAPGTPLIEQGKLNNHLFFMTRGLANIVWQQDDKEIFLRQLKSGDIAGEDTFFGISVCTTSVVCQGPVTVKYLDRKKLDEWQVTEPALVEKLRSYCQRHSILDQAQAAIKFERRQKKRYRLERVIKAQLQNLKGEDIGVSFRGVLDDISESGICFYIKSSQVGTPRVLLGRPVRLHLSLDDVLLDLKGVIVGCKYHLYNDHTVHVKLTGDDGSLSKPVDDPLFRQFMARIRAGSITL